MGWPGCQGGVGQQGEATGAQRTVQTAAVLALTGLGAKESGQISLLPAHKSSMLSDRLCRARGDALIQG